MSEAAEEFDNHPPIAWNVVATAFFIAVLIAMLTVTAKLHEWAFVDFLTPYKEFIAVAEVVIIGMLAVETGSKAIYALAVRRTSEDMAGALRIIARITVYGIILSTVVSLLTANPAAALTIGSFAGLVVGFASQNVMNNAIAGMFIAIMRPLHIGDSVTIGSNSGILKDIALLHVVLDTEDREIMIPTSSTVNSILVRHKVQA